jgi:catechol 2,3-dioxygenase-like lactoylglutathione lyase family enzyme
LSGSEPTSLVAGVHHVSINVPDVPAAIEFYRDMLGLTVRADRPEFPKAGAWMDAGGQQVHLIEGEVPVGDGPHFALLVNDLDATVQALRSSGVRVSEPKAVGPGRQSFVTDVAGNVVELHQVSPQEVGKR